MQKSDENLEKMQLATISQFITNHNGFLLTQQFKLTLIKIIFI